MRFALVFVQPCGIGEDVVGEVVVLINEKVDFLSGLEALLMQIVQLLNEALLLVHFLLYPFEQQGGIPVAERVEARVAVRVHRSAVIPQLGIDNGKVEEDDEVFVVVGRRVLPDVEVAVKPFELVRRVDVVVMAQHREGEAFAEAARADEEEELVGVFHFLDEPCLVDIITVVLAYGHEVHHAVRYPFGLSFYHCFFHNRKMKG